MEMWNPEPTPGELAMVLSGRSQTMAPYWVEEFQLRSGLHGCTIEMLDERQIRHCKQRRVLLSWKDQRCMLVYIHWDDNIWILNDHQQRPVMSGRGESITPLPQEGRSLELESLRTLASQLERAQYPETLDLRLSLKGGPITLSELLRQLQLMVDEQIRQGKTDTQELQTSLGVLKCH